MEYSLPMELRQAALPLPPLTEEALIGLSRSDPLRRGSYGRQATTDFDQQWITALHLLRGDDLVGEIRYEVARLFTLLSEDDPEWQRYRFGGIIEFPIVSAESPEAQKRLQLDLLTRAQERVSYLYPGMSLYCFLPVGDTPEAVVLEAAGFVLIRETCIDRKFLHERGLPTDGGPALVYRLDPPYAKGRSELSTFDPLKLLTDKEEHRRIFSNQETKVRLVPTLEFWSAVKPYTTFSAYPLIRSFLRKSLSRVTFATPPRVLVAPSAAGDFLRFWPPEQTHAHAMALDIRADCLELARLRLQLPQIDQVNLALAQLLSEIVASNRVEESAQSLIAKVVQTLDPGGNLSRFDLADASALRLFARSFDEVLRNRAVPDWYFPIKILAGSLGLKDSVSTDQLVPWLEARGGALEEAAKLFESWLDVQADPSLRDRGLPGMANARFHQADLTRPETVPEGMFDIALCWEFIHVFHRASDINDFLSLLTSRVVKGGIVLVTCIRESEPIEPQELLWACDYFSQRNSSFEVVQMEFSGEAVSYERRLRYYYPTLIARL